MLYSLLLTLAAAAAADSSPKAAVSLADGTTLNGRLISFQSGQLRLRSDGGDESLAADRLLRVELDGDGAAPSDGTFLDLADGSRLRVTSFTVKDRTATVATPHAPGELKIPADQIALAELTPRTAAVAAVLDGIDRTELTGDFLVIMKRDGESADYLQGVVGDLDGDHADFDWEGEQLAVKRSRIAAVGFYGRISDALPAPLCTLSLTDGSTILAKELRLQDERLELSTPSGVYLELRLTDLRSLDFSAGKVAYLSDLDPVGVKWTPAVDLPLSDASRQAYGMPRFDESFSGSALALSWGDASAPARRDVRTYAKGLALRSKTEATYRLPAGMSRFAAVAGIDPEAASQGHVLLEIRVGDRLAWQGEIDGRKPPVEIDVPVKGARRLHISVDYGANLDFGDRLHLVDARVIK